MVQDGQWQKDLSRRIERFVKYLGLVFETSRVDLVLVSEDLSNKDS